MTLLPGSLTVPITIFNKKAPVHRICHLCILPNFRTIISGTLDGQICIWTAENEKEFWPKYLLFGHTTSITCLAAAGVEEISSNFVSCAQSGKICLWNADDGRCIESTYTNYVHTSIQAHRFTTTSPAMIKESNQKLNRLLCTGHYSEILVMDPESLQILFSLASRVEPDWISAFNVIKPPHKPDIVVGVSNAGMVKIWTIGSVENKTAACPVYEDESKQVQCFGACSLILCRFNPRTMLIVCQKLWQVFDAFDFSLCCSGRSDGKGNWLGGDFITVDKIMLWSSDGCAYLCQLPKGPLIKDGQDSSLKKFDPDVKPFYYCVLNLSGINNIGKSSFVDASFVYSNSDFFLDPPAMTSNARAILARGSTDGHLAVWTIPLVDDRSIEALKQENFDRLPAVIPDQILSLENLWKENQDQCPGILGCYENLEKNAVPITTTLYIASRGNLVLGRRDGSLVIVSGVRTLAMTFLDLDEKIVSERPSILRLLSVHNGPVTCILYPYEEHKRYEPNHLVTGGADFAVCLIDLHTDTILYRFVVQAGEILRLMVPPPSCTSKVSQSVCSVASDHSVALLGLKDQRCVLLASRHLFPVADVKFRPLDDFLLVRCEDNTVYVWQIETANLDRVLNGRVAEEAIAACKDQLRAVIMEEKAEMEASRKAAPNAQMASRPDLDWRRYLDETPPMSIQGLRCSDADSEFHVVLFNVESLIISILTQNMAQAAVMMEKPQTASDSVSYQNSASSSPRLTSFLNKARDAAGTMLNASPLLNRPSPLAPSPGPSTQAPSSGDKSNDLNYEIAHFLLSILQTWNCEPNMDNVSEKKLGLRRLKRPVPFGLVSKEGHLTLMLPTRMTSSKLKVDQWSAYRYTVSSPLTTQHLVAQVSLADACSTADGLAFQGDYEKIRRNLKHQNSRSSMSPSLLRRTESLKIGADQQNLSSDLLDKFLVDQNQVKQAWNTVASVHCLLLADLIERSRQPGWSYRSPSAELLARRWRDRCPQIRDAAQTLLLRELNRIGPEGRHWLIKYWSQFLPAVQDPSLSILSPAVTPMDQMSTADSDQNSLSNYSFDKTMNIGGPLTPFSSNEPVIRLTRRNQASAVILLGVLGAEYGQDLAASARKNSEMSARTPGVDGFVENDFELARVTSQSLLELLLQPPSFVLPPFAALRRAAVDLLGRGFTVWQPHLDISKVLLALLELCAEADRLLPLAPGPVTATLPLAPEADACMASRRALTLIASARPPAFITALSKEVTRFNAMSQHQTVHVGSPLVRSKTEILRIIEMIAEKVYTDIVDLMLPTSEILIHCMDQSILKKKTLVEMFPFLAKFPMVSYCNQSRKLGFGSKTGVVVVHELRLGKSQVVQAHSKAISACSFSEDGKYLVTYSADEGKLNFWQLTQSFMGMGQSQVKCLKQYSAPAAFAMGANAQPMVTKLTWVAAKAIILTLPNGSEHRFSF